MAQDSRLLALLAPVVESMGFRCWGVDLLGGGRNKVLRIYIDAEQGVNVDDCARVSHQLSGVLDVEDPIRGDYRLEVSSPGMDRPLYTLEQYREYLGALVQLRLAMPFEGRRKYTGRLVGIEGEELVIRLEQEELLLHFSQVERANVVPEFD